MRRTAILAILSMIAALMAVTSPLSAEVPDGFRALDRADRASGAVSDFRLRSPDDVVQVFIQLSEPAVAEVAADGAPSEAQKAQGRRNIAQQDRVRAALSDVIVEELSSMQVAANGLRVKVRAGDVPAIRATEGVISVSGVTRYHLTNEDSVPWIGGDVVKNAEIDGDGVSIAVIDTGIDYTHAAFGGPGTVEAYDDNETGIIESGTFPTDKVAGGFDFAGPNYNPCGDPAVESPSPDPDPLDVNGHGTHVAGTAAGFGTAGHGEGMAPGASLFAFKVFGDATGCTDLVSDALERALDPNNDLDTTDHVDVVNMSLGSDYGTLNDPSSIATQNAVDLGIVVVSSSGNAGDAPYITGSPAIADGAISVAASIDDGYAVNGLVVNSPEDLDDPFEMAIGDFGSLDEDVVGDLVAAEPFDACAELTNAAAVNGNIAFLTRGTCDFTVKLLNAQNAGAIAAVVVNNVEGAPIVMGQNGDAEQPTIPGVMVRIEDGEAIADAMDAGTVNVTLSDDILIPIEGLEDTMADFSSRGPGHGNVFKPDVSAPGFGIISADVGSGNGGASSNGTSMASPHVAGLAAQVLEKYPDMDPAAVKALIMNSARPANPSDVAIARQGTGVARADVAVLELEGYAAPGGLSFGRINPTTAGDDTQTVTVTRFTGDATYDIDFTPNQTMAGVTLETSLDSVTTSGGEGAFDVTLEWDPSAMPGDDAFWSQGEIDGWITLTNQTNSSDRMVVGVMAVLDPAAQVAASGGESEVALSNTGPGDGVAMGYTLAAEGDASNGSVHAVGYGTFEFAGETVLDLGLVLDPAESINPFEIDVWIDVDQDGEDDYLLVGIDHGLLTAGEFNGLYVTAIVDLSTGGAELLFQGSGDFNDEVFSLFGDITGALGFNPPGDEFDIDVVVWDLREEIITGLIEDVTLDLGAMVTDESVFLEIPAGMSGDLPVEGAGDMLWLLPNNILGNQHVVTSVTQPAPGPGPQFNDVPESHLFHAEIIWLAEEDITRGCNPPANTLFCPDGEVTRGQMAAFLVRALDLQASATDHFDDDDGHLFEAEINALAEAGITRGCNPPANTNFCPDSELSRAEMATFMQRAFDLGASSTDWFVDDNGNIHESAINSIADADITRGCNPPTNNRFCPDNTITRGQMAAFLYRAFHMDS